MTTFDFTDHSHKRFNPLNNSWVLCSPHRAKRPWVCFEKLQPFIQMIIPSDQFLFVLKLGQEENSDNKQGPAYVSDCYLCPGNKRVDGVQVNPLYKNCFVFENDFPAVKANQPEYDPEAMVKTVPTGDQNIIEKIQKLFKAQGVRGCARVICFSPCHNLTMAEMESSNILHIIREWINQLHDLSKLDYVNYVQLFENKGQVMGCSNPHPHGQVWATEDVPQEPAAEIASLTKYRNENHSCLLCDLVNVEANVKSRIVVENDGWICIVPFWAIWPFETLLLPKTHVSCMTELSEEMQNSLADILRRITCKYDNLFETSFPYSMGIHGAPLRYEDKDVMHLHIHFYPPLLRSATVKKFLVGFEMLAQAQRDLTAEQAAERLRVLPETHYRQNKLMKN